MLKKILIGIVLLLGLLFLIYIGILVVEKFDYVTKSGAGAFLVPANVGASYSPFSTNSFIFSHSSLMEVGL